MASRYYGINKGGMMPKDVTEAGASNTMAVEVAIDLTKVTSKIDALQALEAIAAYIATTELNPIS